MRLYLVEADRFECDTVGSAVIWAKDRAQARDLWEEIPDRMPGPVTVTAVRLGTKARVVHTEFNAA